MSSKRSTQTTNTFVSGPSGGKDFPVDDLFVFTKGLNYTKHSEFNQEWNHEPCCPRAVRTHLHMPDLTFLADSRFSEWFGNSSRVRLGCLSKPGMSSVLVSASTVESLCTDDSSGETTKELCQPWISHWGFVMCDTYQFTFKGANADRNFLSKTGRRRLSLSEHPHSTRPSSPRWTLNLLCPLE